jgi:hypothetical protein
MKHLRRNDLPIYPKAFIAAARLHREKNRVFVAMPFAAPHSRVLWQIVRSVCEIHDLVPTRADTSTYPRPIVADILEELESAEIIIADLTGLNPNVLYELGIAHVRSDAVVLLSQRGQSLPFDLASIRCLFYDVSTIEGKQELTEKLGRTLESLRDPGVPTVIEGGLDRTNSVIADLRQLSDLPDDELRGEVVWFSGFLSSFAISEDEVFDPREREYREKLLEERDCLLSLARRGCPVRCIITPPGKDDLIASRLPHAVQRLATLISFLKAGDDSLRHIEWVISPFRQKNFYIIGRICFSEGFKSGVERGYSLTLRQTDPDAIASSTAVHRILFERLRRLTLGTYRSSTPAADDHEALRLAVLKCLRRSMEYCSGIARTSKGKPLRDSS